MTCKFPEHHKSAAGGPGVLVILAVAVLAAYIAVDVALAVVRFLEAWWWTFAAAAAAVVVALVARKIGRRRADLPASRSARRLRIWPRLRHLPRVLWAALRWHHLTANLGLARPDKHQQGKIRRPRAVILPDAHGVVARVRTVPGTGRAELDQAAEHIANAWKVQRVSVSQPKPGRVVVRGMKHDPLLARFDLEPSYYLEHGSPRRLFLGRDEHGADRFADIANCPGICVGGMPGAGKSTELTSWLTQLAPSPAVQFALADGKNAGEFADFTDRAWMMAGDDLDDVINLLECQHGLMTDRLAAVRQVLGVKNAWHRGPSESWPLSVTVLDECQSFFDLTMVKGDKQLEPKVRRAIFLTSSLIRRGRSVMMLTIPATQKPTTDSLPSPIRDNCPISLCFAVKTMDAAKAALGQAIADFPSFSPLTLQGPEYAGCCTVTLRTGQDPFTRLRGPYVPEVQAAEVARSHAFLRRDPRVTAPVVVPDSPAELVMP